MKDRMIVSKMFAYVKKVRGYTANMDYDAFKQNEVILEACVFNLSQLGEIANKTSAEYQKSHTEIPWRQLYGLRNKIVHDYEGVNLKLVWEIISNDLPNLQEVLEQSIREAL